VSRALDRGLEEDELAESGDCGGGLAARYFWSEDSAVCADEVSPDDRAL